MNLERARHARPAPSGRRNLERVRHARPAPSGRMNLERTRHARPAPSGRMNLERVRTHTTCLYGEHPGRSATSPYKQPVLQPPRLYGEHRTPGEVPLRPTNSPFSSHPACTGSTARRAKCHFALQTARPPATPPVRRAPRAKCPFALQTARSPATPPVRRAPRAKCPFALLVYPDSSLWGRRWLMKGGALDRTIGRFPEPERRWPTRCHRVVERLSTFG